MKPKTISPLSRLLLIISGLGLILAIYYPLWRIDLQAPQYPEGLRLLIYADKLAGDVEIINGLNHYIGMRTLHVEDFPEFKILTGIIIFFSAAFILTAVLGRRKWVNVLFVLFVLFGVIAMIDFWRWEYDYGHNLDENAAIKVPGMSYQPPLIGFKQLLNFGAYSIPDIGGWSFIGAGALLLMVVIVEWRSWKKSRNSMVTVSALLVCIAFSGCGSSDPQPINYGRDNCHFCKMTISDKRFGAEVISSTGKLYKFDDVHCTGAFLESGEIDRKKIKGIYISDYLPPNEFVDSEKGIFYKSDDLRSPMAGNTAILRSEMGLKQIQEKMKGRVISKEDVLK